VDSESFGEDGDLGLDVDDGDVLSPSELTGCARGELRRFMFGLVFDRFVRAGPGAVFGRCVGEELFVDLLVSCLACHMLVEFQRGLVEGCWMNYVLEKKLHALVFGHHEERRLNLSRSICNDCTNRAGIGVETELDRRIGTYSCWTFQFARAGGRGTITAVIPLMVRDWATERGRDDRTNRSRVATSNNLGPSRPRGGDRRRNWSRNWVRFDHTSPFVSQLPSSLHVVDVGALIRRSKRRP
jgi:hypothetical protein